MPSTCAVVVTAVAKREIIGSEAAFSVSKKEGNSWEISVGWPVGSNERGDRFVLISVTLPLAGSLVAKTEVSLNVKILAVVDLFGRVETEGGLLITGL